MLLMKDWRFRGLERRLTSSAGAILDLVRGVRGGLRGGLVRLMDVQLVGDVLFALEIWKEGWN